VTWMFRKTGRGVFALSAMLVGAPAERQKSVKPIRGF
jgi:hypothetical protein